MPPNSPELPFSDLGRHAKKDTTGTAENQDIIARHPMVGGGMAVRRVRLEMLLNMALQPGLEPDTGGLTVSFYSQKSSYCSIAYVF